MDISNLFLSQKDLEIILSCSPTSIYTYLTTYNIVFKPHYKELLYSVSDLVKMLNRNQFKGFDGGKFLKSMTLFINKKPV